MQANVSQIRSRSIIAQRAIDRTIASYMEDQVSSSLSVCLSLLCPCQREGERTMQVRRGMTATETLFFFLLSLILHLHTHLASIIDMQATSLDPKQSSRHVQ